MKRRHILSAAFCLTCTKLAALLPTQESFDSTLYTSLLKTISAADSVTLYEGTPHQTWEAEKLKKELASKKTVKLHGCPFYMPPLGIKARDLEPLRQLCASNATYAPYAGAKLCGGFHPDYCLEWTHGKSTCRVLICFGCHEIKLYDSSRPKGLILDINNSAYDAFKRRLDSYRSQRPSK